MKLDEILSSAGARKARKRVGRGLGSGHGKTCGRGTKGFGARAGHTHRLGYEGGQNPLLSRIPKRGFSNAPFRRTYQVVNVGVLQQRFSDGDRVDAEALRLANLIADAEAPVKVLGGGELTKKLTVVAASFSASAEQKITQAGGTAERV